jgi:hypothetical protein
MSTFLREFLASIGLTPNSAWVGLYAAVVAGVVALIVAGVNAQAARV